MRASRATERALLSPAALLLLVLVVGGALYLLRPKATELVASDSVDEVGLVYLRAEVEKRPGDAQARLGLAQALRGVGHEEEALQVLAPLVRQEGEPGEQARALALELKLSLWRQISPEQPRRTEVRQELMEELRGHLGRLPEAERQPWAAAALELGGLDFVSELFGTSGIPSSLLSDNTLQQVAPQEPLKVVDALLEAAGRTQDGQHSDEQLLKSLELLRGVKDSDAVLKRLERAVRLFGGRVRILDRAVAIALERSAVSEARRWQDLRVALSPDDVDALRRQMELALAAAEPKAALAPARRLARLLASPSAHQQAANVASWSGAMDVSLTEWMWLARHEGTSEQLDRATNLARMLWDLRAQVELLMLRARQGELSVEDRAELVRLREALGEPEAAERYLTVFLRRHPADTSALTLLAGLREHQGDLAGAVEAWNALAASAGPSARTAVRQAELLWRMERPREALAALVAARAVTGPKDKEYWMLLGELASTLEDDALALEAFRTLHEADPKQPEPARRVATLLARGPHAEEAVAFARQALSASFDPEVLAIGLESAIQSKRWEEALALEREAQPFADRFQDDTRLGLLEAEVLMHAGALGDARARQEHVLTLEPRSTPARLGLLDVLLQQQDMKALAARLEQWSQEAAEDPAYWEVYASSYSALGQPRSAAAWYERLVRAHPQDPFVLLACAEAHQAAGDAPLAREIRLSARALLEPRAHRLARSTGAAPSEDVHALVTYLELLVHLDGERSVDPWVHLLEGRLRGEPEAQQWLLGHYLRSHDAVAARAVIARLERSGQTLAPWQRLALALEENDTRTVEQLLAKNGSTLSLEDQVLARRVLGQDRSAYALTLQGLGVRDSDGLRQHHMELREQLAPAVELRGSTRGQGDFHAQEVRLRAHTGRIFNGLLETEAWITDLRLDEVPTLMAPDAREVGLGVRAAWGPRKWRTELGAGLDVRGREFLPQLSATQSVGLGHAVQGRLGLDLNVLPEDASVLRFLAVRHQLTLSGEVPLPASNELSVALMGAQYRTRSEELIGHGANGSTAFSHAFPLGGVEARARATYDVTLNSVEGTAPEWQRSRALPLLPDWAMSAGAGLTLLRGDVREASGPGRPVRVLADAWGGWLWPYNEPGYQLRLELGLPLLDDTQVGVDATLGHSLGKVSTSPWFEVGFGLHQRFGP